MSSAKSESEMAALNTLAITVNVSRVCLSVVEAQADQIRLKIMGGTPARKAEPPEPVGMLAEMQDLHGRLMALRDLLVELNNSL